ncbi:TPM domain-containing protein [Carnobacterium antarcticum]|uniref:TPM domain-containing protein n=1 Tax=Carnobacterium antarcticum TaxID=2126436 RepID=A0ABW4NK51_9LACT|nr:TPM domain-containing protein [Carnobacterium sp. CP1]ALV22390.1 hypothetical protein NY10_1792 [Carnobacterium sp. CP1]
MGRGGGSRGGGSSGGSRGGGGSFGGNRGGAGRSSGGSGRGGGSFGGGGSSGRGSYGGNRGSGGPVFRPGPIFMPGRSRSYRRRPSYYGGGGGNSGCGCGTILAILFILFVLFSLFGSFMFSSSGSPSSSNDISKSTIEREPLDKGAVNETAYFTDEAGWISNQTELTKGLKYFYDKTGVQPHVYITDNINGSASLTNEEMSNFSRELYDQLFTDEAHLLLVFYEPVPDQYMDYYVTGTQAKSVIDTEAGDILLDYIDRYYYEDLSDEAFFSKSFHDAADRIMEVTRSPWITVFIVIGSVVLIGLLFLWWQRSKKQKNLEAKQTEDILNTPLEKYGSTEAEELAKKYKDDNEKK